MKIDEALKLIQADIENEDVDWDSPLGKAYKISYEALKRERHNRQGTFTILLPGETED